MFINTTVLSTATVREEIDFETEVDEATGWSREKCEDLGIEFQPKKVDVEVDDLEEETKEVSLWFRVKDVLRIEDNSESPFLVLEGNIYYELKSSQEVVKILNELNKFYNNQ